MTAFRLDYFKNCSSDNSFFESLKNDYPDFEDWFGRKSKEGRTAYVFSDESEIRAFLYIKESDEESVGDLPKEKRMKIGTLKVDDTFKGQRLGEGAVGIALWRWQRSPHDQIYITTFQKHETLIQLLVSFGFKYGGIKSETGESVYYKDKRCLITESPKTMFPYIRSNFTRGRYIPINEEYHDAMFQYSDMRNTRQNPGEMAVSNGVLKFYIATPSSAFDYSQGDIVFIYRKYMGTEYRKTFKSAITSFCTVMSSTPVKVNGFNRMSFETFKKFVGNKTVFGAEELRSKYSKRNVYALELTYNGYFGEGNNINHQWLSENGLWGDTHPYDQKLSKEDVFTILKKGRKDVQNIIVD